jgi:type I restriction enzyme S subunit
LPSLFVNVFGDPVANPRGWPTTPLGDVLESIEAGWSAVGDDRPRKRDELAVLKISAVTSGFFRPEEAKVVDTPIESRVLITPRRGDVLFSRANTRELVAATCLVDRDYPSLFLPDKLWRITPKRDRFTGEYLRFVLASQRFRGEICRRATGTSGSMLNVSQDKVLSLRAPVPPLELQARFGAAVWRAFSLRQNLVHTEAVAGIQALALAQSLFGQSATASVRLDLLRPVGQVGSQPEAVHVEDLDHGERAKT